MYTNILVGLARNYDDDGYGELLTCWSRLIGGRSDLHHRSRAGTRGRRRS